MKRKALGMAVAIVVAAAAGPALSTGCGSGTGAGSTTTSTGGHAATGGQTASSSGSGGHPGTGGGTGGGGADPCAGVACSGHGTCKPSAGAASCACAAGFHAVGLTCVADEACGASTCGNCGTCQVVGGVATCTCPTGYVLQGKDCVLSPNPCDTVKCAADQACVPEAHCQPLGACVQTCDCGNCGNCGPGADWSTQQEYCGSDNQGPATMKCSRPCAQGEGCLPYSPGICWPLEGCFSAP